MAIEDIYDAIALVQEAESLEERIMIEEVHRKNNKITATVEFMDLLSEHDVPIGETKIIMSEVSDTFHELKTFLEKFQPKNVDDSESENKYDEGISDFADNLMDLLKSTPGTFMTKSALLGLINRMLDGDG